MSNASINSKLEFTICKEAGNIAVTAGELIAMHQALCREIANPPFVDRLERISESLLACYRIPLEGLKPLLEVASQAQFQQSFEAIHGNYRDQFLQYASQPRRFVDDAYAHYLELSMMREAATGYPPLKRNFDRLYQYMDKWINNDSWLIMSMDSLFKMVNRLLGEVASLNVSDPDEAWWMYHSLFNNLQPLTALIEQRVTTLAEMLEGRVATPSGAAA